MDEIILKDRRFRKYIDESRIAQVVSELAEKLNRDLTERDDVVFIGILNGAFLFAADLFRKIDLKARISFLKLASYSGTGTTGKVRELIGWNEDVKDKTVVITEDIVDTGNTMDIIMGGLIARKAKDIKVITLLYKPDAFCGDKEPDYVGFVIPNDFVVGYGLDYKGYGRNLPAIYTIID